MYNFILYGAGNESRTRDFCLASRCVTASTIPAVLLFYYIWHLALAATKIMMHDSFSQKLLIVKIFFADVCKKITYQRTVTMPLVASSINLVCLSGSTVNPLRLQACKNSRIASCHVSTVNVCSWLLIIILKFVRISMLLSLHCNIFIHEKAHRSVLLYSLCLYRIRNCKQVQVWLFLCWWQDCLCWFQQMQSIDQTQRSVRQKRQLRFVLHPLFQHPNARNQV